MDSQVETINLATGTNSLTLAGTTAHTIVGGTGGDTITITTGTTGINQTINFGVDVATDRISVNNPGVVITETKNATITNFNVGHDAIKTLLAGTSTTSGAFTAVGAGLNTAITAATSSIFEITGTNVATLTDTSDGGAVELAIINAFGTLTGTPTFTVALYGGGNAGIYQVTIADSGDQNVTAGADLTVELLVELVGVAVDSLTSANFYS